MSFNIPFSSFDEEEHNTPTARPSQSVPVRPLRPLLPKKRPDPSQEGNQELKPRQRGCGLSQCPNPDCELKSHRLYGLTMRQRNTTKTPSKSRYGHMVPLEWNEQSAVWVDRRLHDGMPELPKEAGQLIQAKELFHHFFSEQMEKVRQIYVPFLRADEYRGTNLSLALTNALHCVCILANAKTDMIMRRMSNTPDRSCYAVYGLAASFLRRKLDGFAKEEIDLLLILIIALAGLDFAFERFEALSAHRDALERLVSIQGGLQIVDNYQSQVVAFVSKTDHMLSTTLGKPPLFNQEYGSQNFKLPDSSSGKYGAVWRDPITHEFIDKDVANMCLDSCRLIHMAETEGVTFYDDVNFPADSKCMPFFLCLRGRLGVDYGRLYIHYHPNQTPDEAMQLSKSRCLVIACVLTDYLILWGDYYPMYRHRQATVLFEILKSQPPDEWDNHLDMLIWVYFVLTAAVPSTWAGHIDAVDQLRQVLRKKYDDEWPTSSWREDELTNLRRHLWAESAYNKPFWRTCSELTAETNDSMEESP